ncbi:HMCN [Mytilus coruscus]|uniref:HMCN n=1 Tax=Mytilus coruscus TaxID=42192 RepID=A0A6J8AK98_MYTCO|nr:HMCN [Mytilus coruscus]
MEKSKVECCIPDIWDINKRCSIEDNTNCVHVSKIIEEYKLLFINNVAATLGGTVNLTCNIGGSLFGWHKKGNKDTWFALANYTKYEGLQRTKLTIKSVGTNDAGVYRCFSFDEQNKFQEYGSNITVTLPVNGHFEEWREWDDCSVTCGGGQRFRYRICNHPPPSDGGSNCSGATKQSDTCSNNKCPVNGHFEEWREDDCSVTCGGGQRFRHRICNNPPPSGGGSNCSGDTQQPDTCSNNTCPVSQLEMDTLELMEWLGNCKYNDIEIWWK